MTSPAGVDSEAEALAEDDENGAPSRSVTPWSSRQPEQRRGDPSGVAGQPSPAGQNGAGAGATSAGTGQAGAPGASTPAGTAAAPATTTPAGAGPASVVGPQAGVVGPPTSSTQDPTTESAPAQQPPPAAPALGVDPDTIAAVAPAVISAGTMALGMLPMIASALAGLGSGSGGSGSGSGSGSGDSGTETTELTPEAQQALKTLKLLAAVYGEGESTDPQVIALREELGITETGADPGTGSTATSIKARQLWQVNAATAFNNLDNQLATYITGLAGSHTIDKKAVVALIREVNVALADLGTQAYTKAGQLKVHEILTAALQKAQTIVTGTKTSAADTANAINRLTGQYLYNINGKAYPSVAAAAKTATSAAVKTAVSTALAELGSPYVWGAEGPGSFDCSGLMQYAAAKAGVSIPRIAATQYQQLPKVAPSNIQPGDLIFPAAQFNNGSPTHVMMYIGNGQCVEAPYTGATVRVTTLPSSYHASRWS